MLVGSLVENFVEETFASFVFTKGNDRGKANCTIAAHTTGICGWPECQIEELNSPEMVVSCRCVYPNMPDDPEAWLRDLSPTGQS